MSEHKKNKELTFLDRQNIETMYNKKYTVMAMADFIGCSRATIYRELKRGQFLKRNTDYTESISYSCDLAQENYIKNIKNRGSKPKLTEDMCEYIADKLSSKWSVSAICGFAKYHNIKLLSRTAIYRHIRLDHVNGVSKKAIKSRKKQYNHYKTAKRNKLFPSISKRPEHVKNRLEFGHWELDTVVGHNKGLNQTLLVLTERKTRFEIVRKLKTKTAEEMCEALKHIVNDKNLFKSITCDNGVEFSNYEKMSELTDIYYCHPYSSWERGSNENANRLVRKLYPKGTDFSKLTQNHALNIQLYINNYPRSIFQYKNSNTKFLQEIEKLYKNPKDILYSFYKLK